MQAFQLIVALMPVVLSLTIGGSLSAQDRAAGIVLLTLDVEEQGDAEALDAMGIDVPATYFFTGDYGRRVPGLVRRLAAEGNTIGSHSHFHDDLTTLNPRQLALDLELSRVILESIVCRRITWFRAPYLAYNDAVMKEVVAAGYLADSSDKLHWPVNAELPELAITVHDGRLVADIDAIMPADGAPAPGLEFLIAAFEEQRRRGQPLVVLLHPRIIGTRPDVLHGLIAHARAAGAKFMTADDLQKIAQAGVARRVLWLPRQPTLEDMPALAEATAAHGVTDLVLPPAPETQDSLRDLLGPGAKTSETPAVNDPQAVGSVSPTSLAPHVAALRDTGIRLHLAFDLLAAASDSTGDLRNHSPLSPFDPEMFDRAAAAGAALANNPTLDGIVLTGLGQEGVSTGMTAAALSDFAASTEIVGFDADTVLTDAYYLWIQWRAKRIAALAQAVADAARAAREGGFSISAAVPAQVLLDYRAVESTALDPVRLGPALDALLLTVPDDALAQKRLDRRLRLAAAVQAGAVDLLLPALHRAELVPELPGAVLHEGGGGELREVNVPVQAGSCTGAVRR